MSDNITVQQTATVQLTFLNIAENRRVEVRLYHVAQTNESNKESVFCAPIFGAFYSFGGLSLIRSMKNFSTEDFIHAWN